MMRRRPSFPVATIVAIGCTLAAFVAVNGAGQTEPERPTSRPDRADRADRAPDHRDRDSVAAPTGDRAINRVLEAEVREREREHEYYPPTIARLLSSPRPSRKGPEGWRPLVPDRNEARTEVLARRAHLRAYDGAPPVMPHSRSFVRTKTCLDCHAEGMRIGDRLGPPLSHPHLVNCVQCHVEASNLDLPMQGPPPPNTFRGTELPFEGARAWEGAPPIMPHATLMRTDCLACHGPAGDPGLRTAHPERSNCVQCHAPAAALDQTSPFFTGNDPMRVSGPRTPVP